MSQVLTLKDRRSLNLSPYFNTTPILIKSQSAKNSNNLSFIIIFSRSYILEKIHKTLIFEEKSINLVKIIFARIRIPMEPTQSPIFGWKLDQKRESKLILCS
ncbi:hypothetical protein U1Q18_051158 [Sarracenia purpurea var. burkii]